MRQRQLVGSLAGHHVYKIKKIAVLPLTTTDPIQDMDLEVGVLSDSDQDVMLYGGHACKWDHSRSPETVLQCVLSTGQREMPSAPNRVKTRAGQ